MNNSVLSELKSLKEKDERTRQRLLEEGDLYQGYAEEMQRVHVENAMALDNLVTEYGWPGETLVGLDGSRIAWFIAQHSICTPHLLRKFVSKIEEAYLSGEVPKKQFVLLRDRLLFQEGKPQKCGWVFDWQPNGEMGCEIEDLELSNELRRELSMPSFEAALKNHQESVRQEGGRMPGTYDEYKQQANEWKKQVGWE
ncbi:MAG: hypothetical protein MI867_22165 [Pseudomonadales bacterium]|nr:hypothetical protein [Pseudomonadales bacterium]